jgi:hypothetical protein
MNKYAELGISARDEHVKSIHALKSSLGMLNGRHPDVAALLKDKIVRHEQELVEVNKFIATTGTEYDFIQAAAAREAARNKKD